MLTATICRCGPSYFGSGPVCPGLNIEINNELEVFVQISNADVGFGNNRGRGARLL